MWLKRGKRFKQVMSWWTELYIMLDQAAMIGKSIPVMCWKGRGKKISSMHYQWFLRNPAVRSRDSTRLSNGKGKYTHPYALAQELAICTLYFTEFSRVAVAHSSLFPQSSSEILLCFFQRECAPEVCKKNLFIFWKSFKVLMYCSPLALWTPQAQSSCLLEKMFACLLACFIWNYLSLQPVNMNKKKENKTLEKQFIARCFITYLGKRCISKRLLLQVTRLAGKWCWGKLVFQNTKFWFWGFFHKYNHKFFSYSAHHSYHVTFFSHFFQTPYKYAWLKEGRVCFLH